MIRAIVLALALAAAPRSRVPVRAYMRAHPCPGGPDAGSTTRCRGWKVDHLIPLCAGGPDDPSNMQWQTEEAAAQKDRLEVLLCRRGCRLDPGGAR